MYVICIAAPYGLWVVSLTGILSELFQFATDFENLKERLSCRSDKLLCIPLKKRKYTCQFIDARECKNGWGNWTLMRRLSICHVAIKISHSNCPNTFICLVFPDGVEKYSKVFAR